MKKLFAVLLLISCLVACLPTAATAAPKAGTVYDMAEIFGKGSDYFKFGYFNGDKPGNPPEDKMADQGNGKIGTSHFKFYSWTKYSLHTGIHIVRVDSTKGGDEQNTPGFYNGDIFMMITYQPYIAFVAPADGAYKFEITARRAFNVADGNDGCNIIVKSSRGNTYMTKYATNTSDANFNHELFLVKGDRVYLTVDPNENGNDDEVLVKKFKVTFVNELKATSTVYNVATNFGSSKYKNFYFGSRNNTSGAITKQMTWHTNKADDGTGAKVNGYSSEEYSGGNAVNIITEGSDKGKLSWKPLDADNDKVVVFTAPAAGYYYVEFSPARMWAVSGDRDASEYYVMRNGFKIDNYRTYKSDTINYVFPMKLAKGEQVIFGVHCMSNSAADNSWLALKITKYDVKTTPPPTTTTTQKPETTPEETTTLPETSEIETSTSEQTQTKPNTTKPNGGNEGPVVTTDNKDNSAPKKEFDFKPVILIGLAVIVVAGAVVAIFLVDKKK